ncbi:glycosyltransferase family 2 protein [Hymenobacter busanensis]|uniref:Glycosyltransferase family 2 protein n=1 Tax=Hymenobacter busanensis TaxID=2607656 RepID=A0A7L4ZXJ2_9BACT|nr:glycosyltransferase family 2 protein [Hymenobacter busanensis]KAA9333363.1 glycosyltransferase family 2 protein [Hymenobacter busanensis]QHJ07958.1 glycosyltransferase [Hymenobacter busanensis]
MQSKLVSIIIPTYNRAHLVADAIKSVLAQDYPFKQIIVVDDGSTDTTRQVVSAFPEVEYYHQSNKGQAAARNLGLRQCHGEFLASLDSDDIWNPDFLSAGVNQLQKHQADLVFMNWQPNRGPNSLEIFCHYVSTQQRYLTKSVGNWWLLNAAQTRRLMIETCPAPSSALLMRRNALTNGWNEQMLIADDWSLLLDLVLQRPITAAFTLTPHWQKRIHDQNIYDGRDYAAVVHELSFHDGPHLLLHYQQQLTWSERRVFQQRQASSHFRYAYHSYKHRESLNLLRHLSIALYLAPLTISHRLISGAYRFARRRAPLA